MSRPPSSIFRRHVGPGVPHRGTRPPSDEPTLRLLLNAEDLAKAKVSSNGGPFTESLFSLRLLRERRPRAFGSDWVKAARSRLRPRFNPLAILGGLELLVDLHAVASEAPSIQEAMQWLEDVPSKPLPTEPVGSYALSENAGRPEQSWRRDLLQGESEARRRLVRMFLDYHLLVVDPYWKRIRSHLDVERARCGQVVTGGGVDHLLASLHPGIRWRAPFLEVDIRTSTQSGLDPRLAGARWHDGRATYVLDGCSLVFVPSVFCMDAPHTFISSRDEAAPIVVVYPTLRRMEEASSLWTPPAAPRPSALAKLLGRTQAAALRAIADTCTTTELAHRIGVSLPTASHHASILRAAGLILSRRTGTTVTHSLTPLGAELLGDTAASP